jgi:hypothetical protein
MARTNTQIPLIGAPTEIGASERSASMGSEAMRVANTVPILEIHGLEVVDRGNLVGPANPWQPPFGGYRHLPQVAAWHRSVHEAVYQELELGRLPILLTGDHCLGIGSRAELAPRAALEVEVRDATVTAPAPTRSNPGHRRPVPSSSWAVRRTLETPMLSTDPLDTDRDDARGSRRGRAAMEAILQLAPASPRRSDVGELDVAETANAFGHARHVERQDVIGRAEHGQ